MYAEDFKTSVLWGYDLLRNFKNTSFVLFTAILVISKDAIIETFNAPHRFNRNRRRNFMMLAFSKANFKIQLWMTNQVLNFFEKSFINFYLSLISDKKIAAFGTKYFRTHVPTVILKFSTTTPKLTSNCKTHKNVGGNF